MIGGRRRVIRSDVAVGNLPLLGRQHCVERLERRHEPLHRRRRAAGRRRRARGVSPAAVTVPIAERLHRRVRSHRRAFSRSTASNAIPLRLLRRRDAEPVVCSSDTLSHPLRAQRSRRAREARPESRHSGGACARTLAVAE